jgi:CTP-dependent riboflavin kinase
MMNYRNLLMTAITVALVAANAVSYAAQDGKRWTHLGEVSSVTGDQLVMTQPQGQERTFTVTADAKVTLDRRTIVAADLKPGTKIRVTTTKDDQNAVSRIEAIDKRSDFADSFRDGNLVSITGNQLVMASRQGREHSHTLAADAALILDGKACEAADLKPGMEIRATTEGADQSVVNRVEAFDKTAHVAKTANVTKNHHDGKVVRFTDNRLVMTDLQGQEHSHTLMANAKLTLDGEVCEAADLKPGTKIRVTTRGTDRSVANRIEGIDKNPDFASSIREGGLFGGTDNQLVQPRTNVRMATEGTNQNVTDRSDAIDQRSDAASTQQDGKLVSITRDRLVMTGARGNAERTCTLATDVRVTCDGRTCKSEDLKAGMRIRVTSESEAPHKTIRIEALDKNIEFASL